METQTKIQLNNYEIKSKKPILLVIFARLIFLFGLLTLYGSYVLLSVFSAFGLKITTVYTIAIAIGSMIIGIGIGYMRRWALYGFTVFAIFNLISASQSISFSTTFSIVVNLIIPAGMLIYFWSLRKKFI